MLVAGLYNPNFLRKWICSGTNRLQGPELPGDADDLRLVSAAVAGACCCLLLPFFVFGGCLTISDPVRAVVLLVAINLSSYMRWELLTPCERWWWPCHDKACLAASDF